MPNSKYVRGRAAEHKVKALLEEGGWWVVRAAGSKGQADLVGVRDGIPLLVQVKSGKAKISRKEGIALMTLCRKLSVWGVVAYVRPREPISFGEICA